MDRDGLRKRAEAQAGLFTRRQAQSFGYTTYQIRARLRRGDWQVILGSVLATAGVRVTTRLRDRAAVLAVPGVALGALSAARLHGMPVPERGNYLIVGRQHRLRLAGVTALRCAYAETDIYQLNDLFVTRPGRTVFDCLRILPFADAEDLLDRALQQRWVRLAELTALVRAHVGMRGVGQVINVARRANPGARYVAERLLVSLLRGGGIGGWVANYEHEGVFIDLAFPELRLAIEVDGRAWHSSADRFEADRRRQNKLVTDGWRVLRFTWRDLTDRPAESVAEIQRMLATKP